MWKMWEGLTPAAVRETVLWFLFKLLQAAVAAVYTLIVLVQTELCGIYRRFRDPPALLKVQQARRAWTIGPDLLGVTTAGQAPAAGGALRRSVDDHTQLTQRTSQKAAGSETVESGSKPLHIFPEPTEGHDSLAWRLVGPYMRKYGRHAIANSQLFNPEYIHFYLPGVGALPYLIVELYNRAAIFGVSEPLAHRSQWRTLTEQFLQEFPEAYFYHVTDAYAELLHDMGYYVNKVGSETTLQVQSWTYTGKTRTIRAAARAAREAGVRVRELQPEELTDEMRHKLQHDVSGDWHQQKSIADRHLRVFVRHVDYDTMQLRDGVRIFVAEAFDPLSAPPAFVDPVLQAAALNAKPPKPPRVKRLSRASSSSLLQHERSSSQLTSSTSCSSIGTAEAPAARPGVLQGAAGPVDAEISISSSFSGSSSSFSSSSSSFSGSSSTSSAGSSTPRSDCDASVRVIASRAAADDAAGTAPTAVADASDRGAIRSPSQELVGFVLLDPLWQEGEAVGYVASLMRMKRSAHTGTLKLLCEDIISTLRREGKQELTFGFAPLFNLRDGQQQRRYLHWMRWMQRYLFLCGNNVYAFKNLAFAKIRYGAGLDEQGKRFKDPNVQLTDVYMATKHYLPGFIILDMYAFLTYIGLIDNPFSVFAQLVGLKKGGANLE